jgi:hypothetical protein
MTAAMLAISLTAAIAGFLVFTRHQRRFAELV